jgi:hypothetical protein
VSRSTSETSGRREWLGTLRHFWGCCGSQTRAPLRQVPQSPAKLHQVPPSSAKFRQKNIGAPPTDLRRISISICATSTYAEKPKQTQQMTLRQRIIEYNCGRNSQSSRVKRGQAFELRRGGGGAKARASRAHSICLAGFVAGTVVGHAAAHRAAVRGGIGLGELQWVAPNCTQLHHRRGVEGYRRDWECPEMGQYRRSLIIQSRAKPTQSK